MARWVKALVTWPGDMHPILKLISWQEWTTLKTDSRARTRSRGVWGWRGWHTWEVLGEGMEWEQWCDYILIYIHTCIHTYMGVCWPLQAYYGMSKLDNGEAINSEIPMSIDKKVLRGSRFSLPKEAKKRHPSKRQYFQTVNSSTLSKHIQTTCRNTLPTPTT